MIERVKSQLFITGIWCHLLLGEVYIAANYGIYEFLLHLRSMRCTCFRFDVCMLLE
jgi:hypothetical protein